MKFLAMICVCLCTTTSLFAQSRAEKAQEEWKKLDEMGKTLTAPEYVGRNAEVDLEALRNCSQFREHLAAVAKEYAAEIKEDNQPFRNLGIAIRYVGKKIDDFEAAAKMFGSVENITADLNHVVKMAKQAIEYQAPAYFKPENDIGIRTASAKHRIRYLEATHPKSPELKQAQKLLADTAKQVRELQAKLSKQILEQNELPPDEYRAADRDQILKILTEKWSKEGTKAKVLKVGIVTSDWTRGVTWEIQNRTLYKLDRSRIQGYVIVAHNDKVAVRRSINLVKDHLSKDKITASFLDDPKSEPELESQILLSKVK